MLSRSAKATLIKLSAQQIAAVFLKTAGQPGVAEADPYAEAENEHYRHQLKNLYDQLYGTELQTPTAREQEAKVLSVPQ